MTIYDYFFQLITTHFLPLETALEGYNDILITVCVVLSLATLYVCILRPFARLIKYGLFLLTENKKNKYE